MKTADPRGALPDTLRIELRAAPEQLARLRALQAKFAAACNVLAPLVRDTRCWNRVALHHMSYKRLREQFPELGSQMVCNAIYSVSRNARLVYQHPKSPFNVLRLGDKALPLLHFTAQAPVFFDRHTLSLKEGMVSMFTLDGRMRFELELEPEQEQRFRDGKLREIALLGAGRSYALHFVFGAQDGEAAASGEPAQVPAGAPRDAVLQAPGDWPEYVLITPDIQTKPKPLQRWLAASAKAVHANGSAHP